MNNEITIIPTCIPQSGSDVVDKIQQVSRFSDTLHIDINDGIFAVPASWPYVGQGRIGDLTEGIDIPVDNFLMQIHLMVSEPREIGEFFIRYGASCIILHVEAYAGDGDVIRSVIDAWRAAGVREIGLAILLDTPIGNLDSLLPFCDFVLMMSISTIGSQGASFEPRIYDRIHELHSRLPDLPIAVDGGVSLSNIANLVQAGAKRFSVGSAIMHATDPAIAYAQLKAAAENALQCLDGAAH